MQASKALRRDPAASIWPVSGMLIDVLKQSAYQAMRESTKAVLVTCRTADQLLQPHEQPVCEGQLGGGAKDDALAVAADTLQAELGVQVRPHKDLHVTGRAFSLHSMCAAAATQPANFVM